ncbi:hypothetical protein DKX38_013806 [Salix brachista]|uniref:Uncharacterized protein n=1 Tax=Salix brachista TaxID=2182728 RepID=A0A5N5LE37_9ROSI|nr:hypothetical protein DKX38_013806 [Salix brachista]
MACEDQCRQGLKPKYDCLLFDVDDTLYPRSSGLLEEVTENIQEYMVQKLGVEETEASQINGVLYKSYGTSMAGLKAIGYDFDNDDYHRFVHGRLPYERLKPDNVLRSLLLSLPIRKVIFSNADKAHVAKVLSRLGLEDCFDGVICFETLNPCNYEGINSSDENGVRRPNLSLTENYKVRGPMLLSYADHQFHHVVNPPSIVKAKGLIKQFQLYIPLDQEHQLACTSPMAHQSGAQLPFLLPTGRTGALCHQKLLQHFDIHSQSMMSDSVPVLQETPVVCKPFEDAFEQAFKLANINPRKTVFFDDSVRNIKTGKLMGLHTVLVGTASRINGADYALESIHNMKEALSDLWEAEDKTEARSFAGKVSMETTVTA